METGQGVGEIGRRQPFRNFLRGMETTQGIVPCVPLPTFRNFLRGMETPRPPELRVRLRLLPKLP